MGWKLYMDNGLEIDIADVERDKMVSAFSKGEMGRPFRVLANGVLVSVSHIVCIKDQRKSAPSATSGCAHTDTIKVFKLNKNDKKMFYSQCVNPECNKLLGLIPTPSDTEIEGIPEVK